MPNLNDLKGYLTQRNTPYHQVNDNRIIFELKFYRDDGRPDKVELEVVQMSDLLFVKATNDRYPDLCPNRHINQDGWFCLGLSEDISQLTIQQWVNNLKLFLDAQHKCEKMRVWPRDSEIKEWAHGDAAKYQKIVEQYYGQFKENCLGLILEQLSVVEVNSVKCDKKLYHVYADDELILVGDQNQVLNKRYACICDPHGLNKHQSIGKYSDQCSKVVFMVAINDYLLHKAEKEFWDSFGKQICCNTMKNCNFKKDEDKNAN